MGTPYSKLTAGVRKEILRYEQAVALSVVAVNLPAKLGWRSSVSYCSKSWDGDHIITCSGHVIARE